MKHFYRCPYILRLAIGSYFHTYVLFVFSRISKFNASITTLSGCIKEATSGIVDDLKSPAGLWNSIYFQWNQTKTYAQPCGSLRALSLCGCSVVSVSNVSVVLPWVNTTYGNLKNQQVNVPNHTVLSQGSVLDCPYLA